MRCHVVRAFVLQPLDAALLEQETLLSETLAVLLHPLQVLALGLFPGAPLDVSHALLPAAASGPNLQRAERRGPPQAGPAGVGTEGCRESAEASFGPEGQVDAESAFLARGGGHYRSPRSSATSLVNIIRSYSASSALRPVYRSHRSIDT